ncbi:MAG: hypothetical protein MJY78_00750 [Fibrobacter sp.]|nr:hypothetical protein [Fibrobacter sp.]
MTRWQKVGFRVFIAFFVLAVAFSYVVNSGLLEKSGKPWHMQPFVDEDSLSVSYMQKYSLLDKMPILSKVRDSSKATVVILVDAWGVPFDESQLEMDFAAFKDIPHKEYLHYRMANRTRHAENAEFRNSLGNGFYLFGGDSLEYGRNGYADSLGYVEKIFCQHCDDAVMLAKLDSVLQMSDKRIFALTTQDSRLGERKKLLNTLKMIARLAEKHPGILFIVQGTHRPTLGDPKIRRQHYAKWVPVVVME